MEQIKDECTYTYKCAYLQMHQICTSFMDIHTTFFLGKHAVHRAMEGQMYFSLYQIVFLSLLVRGVKLKVCSFQSVNSHTIKCKRW